MSDSYKYLYCPTSDYWPNSFNHFRWKSGNFLPTSLDNDNLLPSENHSSHPLLFKTRFQTCLHLTCFSWKNRRERILAVHFYNRLDGLVFSDHLNVSKHLFLELVENTMIKYWLIWYDFRMHLSGEKKIATLINQNYLTHGFQNHIDPKPPFDDF